MGIHVCVSGHDRKLHNTCTHFHDKIKKVGPPAPASSTRFQAYEAWLFPFSFLCQHKQMYIHTGARFKNVQNYHLLLMTTDSDINDVSMYYCDLLLLPWVLCEICILSFTILPASVSCPFLKKKMFWFCVTQGSWHWEMLSDRCKSHDFRSLEMCT